MRPGRPKRSFEDDERDAHFALALVEAYEQHGRGKWAQPFMANIGETCDHEVIIQRLIDHRFIHRDRQPFRLAYKARVQLGKWD